MTMPNERTRSLKYVREFLRALLDPKKTPRIPRSVRREAYNRLKHFPSDIDIEKLHEFNPKVWGPLE